jgi:hypothetical protein
MKLSRKFGLHFLSRRAVLDHQPEVGGRPTKKKVRIQAWLNTEGRPALPCADRLPGSLLGTLSVPRFRSVFSTAAS